jgi:short-subunit dehydrogenase
LASEGYDLVIASRDVNLEQATGELAQEYGVAVEALRVDLAVEADVARVAKRIGDAKRPVELVINNAGFALHNSLLDGDDAKQEAAMTVMALTVLKLSGAAARAMVKRGHGQIINVSSTSGWLYSGNYSAIKRWVMIYTQGLALELEGTGVQATAVCPGWARTDFHVHGGVDKPKVPDWLWIEPSEIVRAALKAVRRGRAVVVPTVRWRVAIWVAQHGPEAIARGFSRKLLKTRLAEERQKHGSAKGSQKHA